MKMKPSYTIIKNELLAASQLSIQARYLHMVLLRFAGQDDFCYPSQDTLATIMNLSVRRVRTYLEELCQNKLVRIDRSGYNRTNTYYVSKDFKTYLVENDGKSVSPHIGSIFPLNNGNALPTKGTYRKRKDKNISELEIEKLRITRKRLAENKVMQLDGRSS